MVEILGSPGPGKKTTEKEESLYWEGMMMDLVAYLCQKSKINTLDDVLACHSTKHAWRPCDDMPSGDPHSHMCRSLLPFRGFHLLKGDNFN